MRRAIISVLLLAAVSYGRFARADTPILIKPLPQLLDQSDVVLIAQVTHFVEEPASPTTGPSRPAVSDEDFMRVFAFQGGGTYHFHAVSSIKGVSEADLTLTLQPLSRACYIECTPFEITTGSRVLLFLKKQQNGDLDVVDRFRPLFLLSVKAQFPLHQPAGQAAKLPLDIYDIIIDSLSDRSSRPSIALLLSETNEERAERALRACADDPDMTVRARALSSMAKAQDVAAIPKIAEMAAAVQRNHRGHAPVGSLSAFRTPKAVGFLNPLIITGTEQVRNS